MALVAGYVALHAYNAEPIPSGGELPDLPTPTALPEPKPLPTPNKPRGVVEATLRTGGLALDRTKIRARINLTAPPPDPTVLGVLDELSRTPLRWVDLSGDAGKTIELDLPAGEHLVVVADSRERARFGYRAMMALGTGEPASATIDPRHHDVAVVLRWPTTKPRPLVSLDLRRSDDPSWRWPISATADALAPVAESTVLQSLGAGQYELVVHGAVVSPADRGKLRFAVPSTRRIELSLAPRLP